MDGIMEDFLKSLMIDSVKPIESIFYNITTLMMYAEQYISDIIDNQSIANIYQFVYLFFLSLLALKILKKGFFVYILWRDGDADISPKETLLSIGLAITTAALFPLLYDYLAEITFWFSDTLCQVIFGSIPGNDTAISGLLDMILNIPSGLISVLMAFIYLLCLVIFWFQVMRRSIEMLILRMGFPLACLGLIDSDSGVFKPYVKLLFQAAFTILVQVICFNLSVALINSDNGFFAIGTLLAAINGPQLLNSMLVHTGGTGNPGHKVQQSITIFNAARTLGRGR